MDVSLFFPFSDFRNEINEYQLIIPLTLTNFDPQTTEPQPFKAECFSMKTLKFQHDDAIIYDISRCCEILFGM